MVYNLVWLLKEIPLVKFCEALLLEYSICTAISVRNGDFSIKIICCFFLSLWLRLRWEDFCSLSSLFMIFWQETFRVAELISFSAFECKLKVLEANSKTSLYLRAWHFNLTVYFSVLYFLLPFRTPLKKFLISLVFFYPGKMKKQ